MSDISLTSQQDLTSSRVISHLKPISIGILRYVLGFSMLIYGMTKIMRTQFVIPGTLWVTPLEWLDGMTITWAFLGYSEWFTVLLGLLEFVPGVLLLFRKTHYLGALLLLPVALNVTLINFALDLWPGTKQWSIIFLICNLLILLSGLKHTALPIMKRIWDHVSIKRFSKLETAVNSVAIGAVIFVCGAILIDYRNQRDFLTGDWLNKANNIWTVDEVDTGRQRATDDLPWNKGDELHFSTNRVFSAVQGVAYWNADEYKRLDFAYELKEAEQTLHLRRSREDSVVENRFTYDYDGDSLLTLKLKTADPANRLKIVLKRRVIARNKVKAF